VVPAIGLVELVAHVVEIRAVVPDADWKAARSWVAAHARSEDLVAFAPPWADPLGREQFGRSLATVDREARADDTRFPRAYEVSIRGAHLPELDGWRRGDTRKFGRVAVTTWDNPSPAHVIDDLVSLAVPDRLQVSRVEGGRETPCPFSRTRPQTGGLGFGPGVPGDRFACPGGFVGVSIVPDLDYYGRRCIYAPPPGGNAILRLRFAGVHLGKALHGHQALYVEAERDRRGPPVTLQLKVGDTVLGTAVHKDGDGWQPFEFDTHELDGQEVDLVAEIASPSGHRRMYCFEVDSRR
jgi:hypothetical protein